MGDTHQPEDEQTKLWNGTAGHAWVEAQEVLDSMFKPLEDLLVEAVVAGSASQVLDVGCGTGSTTLAIARRLGAQGRCIGVDISEPMLAAARVRAGREGTPASFLRANAQHHPFESASFDKILSRFGVMFFDDPVQAFTNLRRAAKHDAELRFIAWRSPAENPFMTTAERAAAPLLPNIPARRPDAPGQFAFADSRRVHRILEGSDWAGIDIQPLDVTCTLPEKELVGYFTRFGSLGRLLPTLDMETRTRVIETVRAAFEPFVHRTEVQYTAACWTVGARA
ncbi:class I SAM-dependent methyltransferase [Corallococcus aberystwythensis]|uniref:Class I SAM-dependent methyltransferase n=1 Tax=Corallococcus aberystwythensis TaxID=2316722 RepID=A0A3A8R320_9BACT|nr:class I SAM-dependent methyltransferase [Corallococcus aberystwythensis]RKH73185.1 class I SAM-dependent methyltransferase [Corallococcus aberystwythensis]